MELVNMTECSSKISVSKQLQSFITFHRNDFDDRVSASHCWLTLLIGWQEGHLACKKHGGMMEVGTA